jgi:hypothetical protein
MRIKKNNLRKLIKEITAGKNASPKRNVRFKGREPVVWIDGVKSDITQCPAEIKRIAKLFDSLDPSRDVMYDFRISGRGDRWDVNMFGERWVNVRTWGRASDGGYSAGGDWRNVNFGADEDSEEKCMVGIWATMDETGRIEVEARSGLVGGFGPHQENDVLSKGRRVKVGAVKEWAQYNVKFSGSGNGRKWQEEPFGQPGGEGSSVVIGASY